MLTAHNRLRAEAQHGAIIAANLGFRGGEDAATHLRKLNDIATAS